MDEFSEAINISSRGAFEKSIANLDESLSLVKASARHECRCKSFNQELVELLQQPIEESYAEIHPMNWRISTGVLIMIIYNKR